MNKIFVIIGKTASGKNTVEKDLLNIFSGRIKCIIPYTTRPMRDGETEGDEYHFVKSFDNVENIIERRSYNTVYGKFEYATVDDGVNLKDSSYININTLEGLKRIKQYFGEDNVVPVYIDADTKVRTQRYLKRSGTHDKQTIAEIKRRMRDEDTEYTEEALREAGVRIIFDNTDYDYCIYSITQYIQTIIGGKQWVIKQLH